MFWKMIFLSALLLSGLLLWRHWKDRLLVWCDRKLVIVDVVSVNRYKAGILGGGRQFFARPQV